MVDLQDPANLDAFAVIDEDIGYIDPYGMSTFIAEFESALISNQLGGGLRPYVVDADLIQYGGWLGYNHVELQLSVEGEWKSGTLEVHISYQMSRPFASDCDIGSAAFVIAMTEKNPKHLLRDSFPKFPLSEAEFLETVRPGTETAVEIFNGVRSMDNYDSQPY